MKLNINKLIRQIKNDIGLTGYYKTNFSDHDLYDIIKNHALVEWSRYFKLEVDMGTIGLGDNLGSDIYFIPDWIIKKVEDCNLRIEDIKKIRFSAYAGVNAVGAQARLTSMYVNQMNLNQAYAGVSTSLRYGATDKYVDYLNACHFESPNRIRFTWNVATRNKVLQMLNNGAVSLSLRVSNPENLSSIDTGREHRFYELAMLNIMIVVYQNESKYIESINTGMGNLNLKIEDWQSAKDRKAELLEQLRSNSILHQAKVEVI